MFKQPENYDFIQDSLQSKIEEVQFITNSGSNRKYFRIRTANQQSFIVTENEGISENKSYWYFQSILAHYCVKVPQIYHIHSSQKTYIQEDLGDINLLQVIQNKGFTDETFQLLQKTVLQLAQFQIQSKNKIDFSQAYDFQCFDEKVVQNDMFYFKDYFLDRLDIPYSKSDFISDINQLAKQLIKLPSSYFLYRDFQSRNVMIKDNDPYFIDFQGAMKGFIGYDIVSFLYQAKANLPYTWRDELKKVYFNLFEKEEKISVSVLEEGFTWGIVLRFFQLLGAYGFRGLVEQKPHFKDSLLVHLDTMKLLLQNDYLNDLPTLKQVTEQFTSQPITARIYNMLQ